jgi:ubiquitin carboxyl-terminal hydrolase L5
LKVPLIVDDLYSLDSESLAQLQPIHALIFLFKWVPVSESTPTAGLPRPDFQGFFAHQVVNNACATVAVINALGNLPSILPQSSSAEPTNLQNLISFAQHLDPTSRGLALTNSDWLREAHNSLSPPSAVSLDGLGLPQGEKEDAYHFVVYLPVDGSVYELDGLKEFAISHGQYDPSGEGWLAKARTVIEQRIGTYPPGAVCPDHNMTHQR